MDQELLKHVIEILENICDMLYQEKITEAYGKLPITLNNLERVIVSMSSEELQEEMKNKLLEALQAMEDEDYIMLADILQYEINDRLKELAEN